MLAGERRLATEMQTRTVGNATHEEHYQRVAPCPVGSMPKVLAKFLGLTAGGSKDMQVDGSVTPQTFDLTPGASAVYRVERIVMRLVCTAAPVMTGFGNLAALANGVLLEWRKNDTADPPVVGGALELDLLDGVSFKAANDLLQFEVGILANTMELVWAPRQPIRLDGGNGEMLRATVRDNLTALTSFRTLVEGGIETELT